MTSQTIDQRIHRIFDLYKRYGADDYIGEPVSQIEHMSQSAELALAGKHDDEIILAAFFHDIGHLCADDKVYASMDGYGVQRHEKIGADYLRAMGFPEKVAKLVENHVQAKRYLTFRNPDYYSALSEASKKTLEFQGGRMTQEEATAFERDALFEESLLIRRWDELAKETGRPITDLKKIEQIARNVLARAHLKKA